MTLCLTQLEEQAKHVNAALGVKASGWTLEVPIRIRNGCNLREHPMARHRRVNKERLAVMWALFAREREHTPSGLWRQRPELPVVVTITRLAPRKLDDDNCIAGCKAVRDEVAKFLGVDDADPRVTWRYAQERAKTYACRISIEEGTP